MRASLPPPRSTHCLACLFQSGEAMRSRRVSDTVLSHRLDIPVLPPRLAADLAREIGLNLRLEPGDVDTLSLARARSRWPRYRQWEQAVLDWTSARGLGSLLADCDVALMASRGARYHHDGAQYGGAAFCNLFLGEDCGQDLHFPAAGHRIPLARGTVVVFDTCQPHGVIARHGDGFRPDDFGPGQPDSIQLFLTWELPVEHAGVAHALQIAWHPDPPGGLLPGDGQVLVDGVAAQVCAESGRWILPRQPFTPCG